MIAMLHCDARDEFHIKSNNFCGRCRSWAPFIALSHWSLAVHLFAVPFNRKRVYNLLVGLNEKLSCKGISSSSVLK
jgi:hypothetical protein